MFVPWLIVSFSIVSLSATPISHAICQSIDSSSVNHSTGNLLTIFLFVLCSCARSLLLPPQEAAQSTPPSSQPEVEDTAAQEASAPSQNSGSKQQATATHTNAAADEMDIDITGNVGSDSGTAPQRSVPQAVVAPGSDAASTSNTRSGARSTGKGKQGSAKPTHIAKGSRLVRTGAVPKSHTFADAGSIKAALANAWSSESDVGKQLAALYELFGDSILPYVPMLPCFGSSV